MSGVSKVSRVSDVSSVLMCQESSVPMMSFDFEKVGFCMVLHEFLTFG